MNDKNLEPVNGFLSKSEFEKFVLWMEGEIKSDCAQEVPVEEYFAGVNFKERWLKIKGINGTWRLVYPDGPFRGYWGKVME